MTVLKNCDILSVVYGGYVGARYRSESCLIFEQIPNAIRFLKNITKGEKMATSEQVELVLEHLKDVYPVKFFQALNEENVGAGAVLRYLHESPDNVTAGNISEFMHVSTARVAVLIKKMSAQGLVTKEGDANDARITIVRITPKGEEKIRQIHDDIYSQVSNVIDQVGVDRIMDYISISNKIKMAVSPRKF